MHDTGQVPLIQARGGNLLQPESLPKLIDLFCGAGGLATGFASAGFETVAASDIWKPAADTYQANHPGHRFMHCDIQDLTADQIFASELNKENLVVAGGPPCQGFSSAGARRCTDNRNTLVSHYAELAVDIRPAVIIFENVEGFLTVDQGKFVIDLLGPLIESGYRVRLEKYNVSNFGVPQLRKRVIGIASLGRNPLGINPTTYAWGMPGAELIGQGLPHVEGVSSYLSRFQLNDQDPLAVHRVLSDIDLARIKGIPQGGTMRDLPPELRHASWSMRANRRVKDGTPTANRGGAPSGMRRLLAEAPSKAITSAATREFIHPTENRFITQREAALLQTFPPFYQFLGTRQQINTLIGNAIPPVFASHLANSVINTLNIPYDNSIAGGIHALKLTNSTGMSPALSATMDLIAKAFPIKNESSYMLF